MLPRLTRLPRLLIAAGAASLVAPAGCVNHYPQIIRNAAPVSLANPIPIPVRNNVYLFIMNGRDYLEISGIDDLRNQLCYLGFPKVYYAQMADNTWFYQELRRLARDEPQARIVLCGYSAAAERVVALAEGCVQDGVTQLDSVVFLDPTGVGRDLTKTLPVPTVTVRSEGWTGSLDLITNETVPVGPGHFNTPKRPESLAVLVKAMAAATTRVRLESTEGLPHLPLRDKADPTPRGIDPSTLVPAPPGWDYLKPAPRRLDAVAPPGPPAAPEPAPTPPPGERLPLPRSAEGVQ